MDLLLRRKNKLIFGVGLVVLLCVILYLIQSQISKIDIKEIKTFIYSFGILGPIVFIILNIITIVISPLTSFPFWIASISLFGFWPSLFYIIIGNNIGSVINFLIARNLGRPVVSRLVGKEGIEKIDEITKIIGMKTLFAVRFFGGIASDYISYAAGLTSMKFKPYFLISFFTTLPWLFLNVYFLNIALTFKPQYLILFALWSYISVFFFPLLIYKKNKGRLQANHN